ncbi:MAG: ParB/RepB/Spo0J family partition protein [Bacteroidales bacterium]|jgi:ParB/RepB/Spo0J family partition protein|nr:ParB/RepB/Spo0J family partition protein [Bacteroidales bacterium]
MPENYKTIPLNHISPGENIREVNGETNKKAIEEMATSLKQSGQLQPIQVYEESDGNYKVLIGFRRYFGARLAKLPTMKCIIVEKPSSITERVYIQATENEQKKSLSSEEREAYITMLIAAGQTKSDIANRLGKSSPAISQAIKAREGRLQFGEKFISAGIKLDTTGASLIAGATEKVVDEAIVEIKNNSQKNVRSILKRVSNSVSQEHKRGRKRKTPPQLCIEYRIWLNSDDDKVKIESNYITTITTNPILDELKGKIQKAIQDICIKINIR